MAEWLDKLTKIVAFTADIKDYSGRWRISAYISCWSNTSSGVREGDHTRLEELL